MRHAFGTDRTRWPETDPSTHLHRAAIAAAASAAADARRPRALLLMGEGEPSGAMFEAQRDRMMEALAAAGWAAEAGTVAGKGHGTMVGHLGRGPPLDTVGPRVMAFLGILPASPGA